MFYFGCSQFWNSEIRKPGNSEIRKLVSAGNLKLRFFDIGPIRHSEIRKLGGAGDREIWEIRKSRNSEFGRFRDSEAHRTGNLEIRRVTLGRTFQPGFKNAPPTPAINVEGSARGDLCFLTLHAYGNIEFGVRGGNVKPGLSFRRG